MIRAYIKPRIQLCSELGSTRLGSGKRINMKAVTSPQWQLSIPTKNVCTAVHCS